VAEVIGERINDENYLASNKMMLKVDLCATACKQAVAHVVLLEALTPLLIEHV
jgi:hypothetical protein